MSETTTVAIETEPVACNLCRRDDYDVWGHKDGVRIVRCRECGLVYANPRPTPAELERYYSRDYFDEGNYQEDQRRQRMYEIEIGIMLPIIGSSGRFLDVGCAMGKFLHTLPDTFEKRGIEFSAAAAEHGRRHFGLDIRQGQIADVELEPESFDVVQMRGVIEHLQDPSRDVASATRALNPGGWFVLLQTPNVGGLSGRVYRERFNQVFPREHLYYFDVRTVSRLLERAGLAVRHIRYPYLGTPYARPAADLVNFLVNYLTGKESPPFFGNMMMVFAQKAKPEAPRG